MLSPRFDLIISKRRAGLTRRIRLSPPVSCVQGLRDSSFMTKTQEIADSRSSRRLSVSRWKLVSLSPKLGLDPPASSNRPVPPDEANSGGPPILFLNFNAIARRARHAASKLPATSSTSTEQPFLSSRSRVNLACLALQFSILACCLLGSLCCTFVLFLFLAAPPILQQRGLPIQSHLPKPRPVPIPGSNPIDPGSFSALQLLPSLFSLPPPFRQTDRSQHFVV